MNHYYGMLIALSTTETTSKICLVSYYLNDSHRKAILIYDDMMKKNDYKKELHLYKACCHYALCSYDEAKREVRKEREKEI